MLGGEGVSHALLFASLRYLKNCPSKGCNLQFVFVA